MSDKPQLIALPHIDRRTLMKGVGAGIAWTALSGCAEAAAPLGNFTHGVASGEPGADRMMLWTRYAGGAQETSLDVEVSDTEDFARIVSGATAVSSPASDWCAKAMVDGLEPGRTFFYRFVAPNGDRSLVGRTKTLPANGVDRFAIGVFCCSNIGLGNFNAYAHAAQVDDIDLVLHLGDYYYENMRESYYAGIEGDIRKRVAEDDERKAFDKIEATSLDGYRLRFGTYRRDPDLQRLHQLFPMVMMWDDHESANNSWRDGAQGHQPETEGRWDLRKQAAMRACREWLPLSEETWTEYQIGDLATLFRPETRLTGRSVPIEAPNPNRIRQLDGFFDELNDPSRTMLGMEQERWLDGAFRRSTASNTQWQILASQVPMGSSVTAPDLSQLRPQAERKNTRRAAKRRQLAEMRIPVGLDKWDGFPAARERLLSAALGADANLVVLSGSAHNAYAFNLDLDGVPAGVDMTVTSVTSNGRESNHRGSDPKAIAREMVSFNPQLAWHDASQRGYMRVEVARDAVTSDFRFSDTILKPSTQLAEVHRMKVMHGARRFSLQT